MRARRDAKALKTQLFLLQAADSASPPLTKEMAKKLLNHFNPHETGHMHGMLPLHLGMRVRLLVAIDKRRGLVQNCEGVVVHIAANPEDESLVEAAFKLDAPTEPIYLKHVPLGVWVRFDKYSGSPATRLLCDGDDPLPQSFTDNLVFLEPSSPMTPFKWRRHSVNRVGFPMSHANRLTSTGCQGMTLPRGVIIDCARRTDGPHPMDDDAWWLDLYVMLSRATKLDDLLLLRAPAAEYLLRGPPKSLQKQLQVFDKRVADCKKKAAERAKELGFDGFLR